MTDFTGPPGVIPRKTRRRHSRAFKEQVLAECRESGESVAAVARRHGLNDNLIHNWRRTLGNDGSPNFIRLPAPVSQPEAEVDVESDRTLLRIEVPSPKGLIIVHWPMSQLKHSVAWLRALTQ